MEYNIKSGDITKQRTACLILGIFSHRQLTPLAQAVDSSSKGLLTGILKRGDLNGDTGQHLMLYDVPGTQAERVLLVGLGKPRELSLKQYRKAIGGAIKYLNKGHSIEAICGLADLELQDANLYQSVREAVVSSE